MSAYDFWDSNQTDPSNDDEFLAQENFHKWVTDVQQILKQNPDINMGTLKSQYIHFINTRLATIQAENEKRIPIIENLNEQEQSLLKLLSEFTCYNGRNAYLPAFVHEQQDIIDVLTFHIESLQTWTQNTRIQTKAKALEASAEALLDVSLEYDIDLFEELSEKWDITSGPDFDKAKALLDEYEGTNPFEKFIYSWFSRSHCATVAQIKEQCGKEIHTPLHLLGKLMDIQPRESEGHLQAIIAVISTKLRVQRDSERIEKRRSHSYSSSGQ